MVYQKAQDQDPTEKTATLQLELGKQYELCILGIGENEYGQWYKVLDDDDNEYFLPNHKDLKMKLRQFKEIQEGDYILIKYIEDKDIGKENPLRIYEVYWDDGYEE